LFISLRNLVARLCPGIDVTVEVEQGADSRECAVTANDWINEKPSTLFQRASNGYESDTILKHIAPLMRELRASPTSMLFGRACVYPIPSFYRKAGVVTVGGFRATEISGIAGLLVGEAQTVSRDSALPIVPSAVLRHWASEQATLLAASELSAREKH